MWVLLVFAWVLPLIVAPVIASSKGRNVGGWFVGALFLGWIAVIIVACLRDIGKTCPFCKEKINKEARICRYCQREV